MVFLRLRGGKPFLTVRAKPTCTRRVTFTAGNVICLCNTSRRYILIQNWATSSWPNSISEHSVSQNDVTSPTPSSSASSSHNGMRVNTTRNTEAIKAALLHVPTSLTSFKHGFSGVLWDKSEGSDKLVCFSIHQFCFCVNMYLKHQYAPLLTWHISTYRPQGRDNGPPSLKKQKMVKEHQSWM